MNSEHDTKWIIDVFLLILKYHRKILTWFGFLSIFPVTQIMPFKVDFVENYLFYGMITGKITRNHHGLKVGFV